MKYRVTHRSEYTYAEPVTLCHNETHLTPREAPGQRVIRHDIVIEPGPTDLARRDDFFGNAVVYFAVQSPHPRLIVTAWSEVERDDSGAPAYERPGAPWEVVRDRVRTTLAEPELEAHQYAVDSPMATPSPEIAAYAAESFPPGRPLVEAVRDLTARIHRDFTYETGVTTIATPLAKVFAERRGVCQDFAHVAIACCRSLGVPARYVSGYIETVPPAGKSRVVGGDASHAWFAVWEPDAGWLDFDPTNDQPALERHITTAWGRDYGDVTPLKGIIFGGGARHTAKVSVDVQRIGDDPPPA